MRIELHDNAPHILRLVADCIHLQMPNLISLCKFKPAVTWLHTFLNMPHGACCAGCVAGPQPTRVQTLS